MLVAPYISEFVMQFLEFIATIFRVAGALSRSVQALSWNTTWAVAAAIMSLQRLPETRLQPALFFLS